MQKGKLRNINVKMTSETSKRVFKEVRPILSLNRYEAKRRVINLYKAWYRQIPLIVRQYDIEYNEEVCKRKLRQEFMKHKEISDIRIIDMLVIRGQMDLKEIVEKWITRRGVARHIDSHTDLKPDCFLAKFLAGKD